MLRCAPNIATFTFLVAGFICANFAYAGVVIGTNFVHGRVVDAGDNSDVFDRYADTTIPASQLVDATSGSFHAGSSENLMAAT